MSFVVAKKINDGYETIEICCDTRVSFNNNIGACASDFQLRNLCNYGLIKSTIICPEFCISFAGNNIFLASKLFLQLSEMKTFSREDVLKKAYTIHSSAKDVNEIEFIISSAEDEELIIDCIKDGKIQRDTPTSWIGSHVAFQEYQRLRLINNQTDTIAFNNVVDGCGDDTVGGMPIRVRYYKNESSFCYVTGKSFISNKSQMLLPGEEVKFYTSARDGGMSYSTTPIGVDQLLLEIDQMSSDILYSRTHRYDNSKDTNNQLFGLMLPIKLKREGAQGWIISDK